MKSTKKSATIRCCAVFCRERCGTNVDATPHSFSHKGKQVVDRAVQSELAHVERDVVVACVEPLAAGVFLGVEFARLMRFSIGLCR